MLKRWFILNEKIRFLILASFNMLLRYLFFVGIGIVTGITHYQVVLIFSWLLSVPIAFYSYKYFVFSGAGNHLHEFAKSVMIWIFSYFFNVLVLSYFVEQLKWNAYLGQGVIIGLIFVINYFLFKYVAFSKTHQ